MKITFGHIYIVLITISWLVLFIRNRNLKDLASKNKNNFDLRNIRFFIIPEDNDSVLLNINCGEKVLRSTHFTEADLMNDRNAPFKEFIKWCEEDYKG